MDIRFGIGKVMNTYSQEGLKYVEQNEQSAGYI
jgi:hypothetical protein